MPGRERHLVTSQAPEPDKRVSRLCVEGSPNRWHIEIVVTAYRNEVSARSKSGAGASPSKTRKTLTSESLSYSLHAVRRQARVGLYIEVTAADSEKGMTYCSSFVPIRRCHLPIFLRWPP